MTVSVDPAQTLIQKLTDLCAALPHVEAVALAGSRTGAAADATSDIDLYIYTRAEIPLVKRQAVLEQSGGASRANMGLTYWGSGDEWVDAATGIGIDLMYFDVQWMADQLHRVLHEHQASLGYSTCFWRTIRHSRVLYDPRGWFQMLQDESHAEYPETLRRNIIAHNHPVLRNVIPAYQHQLEKAVQRKDRISINHRLAGLFASYFDVIFALNRVLHPGEKRLVGLALDLCSKLPVEMAADVDAVLDAGSTPDQHFLAQLARLLDRLDDLLEHEGFDPRTSQPRITR